MRIAVTYEDGNIFQHFGHSAQFKVYDVEDGKVISSQVIDTMGSGHGALAGLLVSGFTAVSVGMLMRQYPCSWPAIWTLTPMSAVTITTIITVRRTPAAITAAAATAAVIAETKRTNRRTFAYAGLHLPDSILCTLCTANN